MDNVNSPTHLLDGRLDESSAIANEFLRSVLIVDDKAYSWQENQIDQGIKLESPSGAFAPYESDVTATDSAQDVNDGQNNEDFFIAAVVDAFADRGIAATILAPKLNDDQFRDRFVKLARNSDAIVLDWFLGTDPETQENTWSSTLIKSLLEIDAKSSPRLRLICIYTGDLEPDTIIERLIKDLDDGSGSSLYLRDSMGNASYVQSPDTRTLSFSNLGVKIVVHKKPPKPLPGEESNSRELKYGELAGKVVSEFTTFAADGLLPKFALEALAAVRNETHQILRRFSSELDPLLFSHRYSTGKWSTETFLAHLATQEIGAVLARVQFESMSSNALSDYVRPALDRRVSSWKASGQRDCAPFQSRKDTAKNTKSAMSFLEIDSGEVFDDAESLSRVILKESPMDPDREIAIEAALKSFSHIGGFFVDGNATSVRERLAELENQFSRLSEVFREYDDARIEMVPPDLRLGLIVERPGSGNQVSGSATTTSSEKSMEYFLCLQPPCDSVRVSNTVPSAFPMVKLDKVSLGSKKRIAVVRSGGEDLQLGLSPRPFGDIEQWRFTSTSEDSKGPVIANFVVGGEGDGASDDPFKGSAGFYLTDCSGTKSRVLAVMRAESAAALARTIVEAGTRPGLRQFEAFRKASIHNRRDD